MENAVVLRNSDSADIQLHRIKASVVPVTMASYLVGAWGLVPKMFENHNIFLFFSMHKI